MRLRLVRDKITDSVSESGTDTPTVVLLVGTVIADYVKVLKYSRSPAADTAQADSTMLNLRDRQQ